MATLVTTPIKVFVSGETVTPTKLNELSQSTVALTAGTIVDADVSASAAIALSKLATGALPTAITVASANLVDGTIATADVADAAITPAKLSQPYTLATSVASTSGTSIDFTGIPSWAKRITVMFNGVSTSATSSIQIQLGTGAGPTFTTSGYLGACGGISNGGTPVVEQNGAGFRVVANINNTEIFHGNITISNLTANTWAQLGILGQSATRINWSGGSVALAAQLTAVRITTVNGTDTFDAGSINIAYEG